jgi:hypothetical protein
MTSPTKNTCRIFEEADGFHFCCAEVQYLDARAPGYKSEANAMRAASYAGYTHVVTAAGVRAIPSKYRM